MSITLHSTFVLYVNKIIKIYFFWKFSDFKMIASKCQCFLFPAKLLLTECVLFWQWCRQADFSFVSSDNLWFGFSGLWVFCCLVLFWFGFAFWDSFSVQQSWLSWNSFCAGLKLTRDPVFLCLPGAGKKGICHHIWPASHNLTKLLFVCSL